MADHNPRFPHTLVVKRPRKVNGEIVTDQVGNPYYDVVRLAKVATVDGWMVRDSDGNPVVDSYVDSIPCGYRTDTRSVAEAGDVVVANISLHTPPFITPLLYDDVLEITDYDRTYKARLVRKQTVNWGCNIWFDERGN